MTVKQCNIEVFALKLTRNSGVSLVYELISRLQIIISIFDVIHKIGNDLNILCIYSTGKIIGDFF